MIDVNKLQKLNALAHELQKQGLYKDSEEAFRQAEKSLMGEPGALTGEVKPRVPEHPQTPKADIPLNLIDELQKQIDELRKEVHEVKAQLMKKEVDELGI